ncbi:ribonuclease H-like domain-containing protein [Tanacetum coccineum]
MMKLMPCIEIILGQLLIFQKEEKQLGVNGSIKLNTRHQGIVVAVSNSWPLYQLDVNNAFLYGDLIEEVYRTLPLGFGDNNDNKVCKLNKSLYGLKQAPRQWNAKLTAALIEHGFVQSKFDYSLFIKESDSVFVALLVYVDDIVITGNCKTSIELFKEFLKNKFMIKDLGLLKYFLGIKVLENKSGIYLTQRKYCLELIHEYGLLAAKPAATPLQENTVLNPKESDNDKSLKNVTEYQKLMGKLISLTHTRPDISYSMQCLSQYMHCPLQSHFKAALRVLRYLKGAPRTGVQFYKSSNLSLKAFFDADWAKCRVTTKSVSGFVIMIGDCPVSWKSKKQPTVSRSSAEAGVWLLQLVK